MRHFLIDYARKNIAQKRGAGKVDFALDKAIVIPVEQSAELIALDEALNSFAKLDPRAAQVVELRFFSGLSVEETAEVLGISPATVHTDWKTARLWLKREIDRGKQ
jgi:RNA polymerase sigma factor (TIGR02999 family)